MESRRQLVKDLNEMSTLYLIALLELNELKFDWMFQVVHDIAVNRNDSNDENAPRLLLEVESRLP